MGMLIIKEQQIIERDSIISSLKDQNHEMSEDYTKYSDTIGNQSQMFRKEMKDCEMQSKEKENSLVARIHVKDREAEKMTDEKSALEMLIEKCRTEAGEDEQQYKVNIEREAQRLETVLQEKV